MNPRGHHAGDMGHVDHQYGADPIGNLPKPGEINFPGVGTGTGDNHFWLFAGGNFLNFIVVEIMGFPVDPIGDGMEKLTGKAYRSPMSQMPAMGQAHAQYLISGIQDTEVDCHIGC